MLKGSQMTKQMKETSVSKRIDEILSGKNLDSYLKERWMISYIKEIGSPFLYDVMLYKQIAAFGVCFILLFFIGAWALLLMLLSCLGLFAWEFYERLKASKRLIREMAGHEKANVLLKIFADSFHTEGMAEWKLKKLKNHVKFFNEMNGRLVGLERDEKNNKELKNNVAHLHKKQLVEKDVNRLNREQTLFIYLFGSHMYEYLRKNTVLLRD